MPNSLLCFRGQRCKPLLRGLPRKTRAMKQALFATMGLAALWVAGASHAQVDYSEIKAGTLLEDGKGIRIGAFIKPVPLPPGDWLVLARNDGRLPVSGGDGIFDSTSQVSVTLKSTNSGNPIYALLVSFAPDSIPVDWNGRFCDTAGKVFSATYGPKTYGGAKACASAQWSSRGLRAFLHKAPTDSDATVHDDYAALAPYAAQAPEPYVAIQINARRDKGRNVDYLAYASATANFKRGDDFDKQIQAWTKHSAQAAMDMLNNTATVMPAFPAAKSAASIN